MKIIDLLNKIANGEKVPKRIKYCATIFYYDNDSRDYISISNEFNSGGISICKYMFCGNLNDEVEIIEEDKKIEKLNIQLSPDDENRVNFYRATNLECELAFKINELIDEINKLKEK